MPNEPRRRAIPVLLVLGGLSISALVMGCRSTATSGAVVIPAPVVSQRSEQGCGLACLAALLAHHGARLDHEGRRRFASSRIEREQGIEAGELRDYLRERGFRAALLRGQLDRSRPAGLLFLLEQRLPIIVELALDGPAGQSRHYVLVTGYHPEERLILIMDPARDLSGVPYERFERAWSNADHLMLVAAPARTSDERPECKEKGKP